MSGLGGVLVILGVLGMMAFTFVRAGRSRAAFARVRRGPLYGSSTGVQLPGSAAAITDGGQVRSQDLLDALGVRAEGADDEDSEDEGTGARLGLAYHRFRHRGSLWDPTVYDGTRNSHQVFLRLGRNASARGPGVDLRRLRSVCAVRVAAPQFELIAVDGLLRPHTPLPPAVTAMLAMMAPSPDVWHDLRVVAGPFGLVTSRGIAQDWIGGWIYDLWLLERIASCLHGAALPPEHLGRDWTPPYGMGDWIPALGDTIRSRPAAGA